MDATLPWAQLAHEPPKWYERFLMYLRLGPEDRSLHAAYVVSLKGKGRKRSKAELTRASVPQSWRNAFAKYEWAARVKAHDEKVHAEETAAYEKRRKAILETGYALHFERVAALKAIAEKLNAEIFDNTKRWLRDVKGVGSGDQFERVDIERFNAPLIEQFRGTLDDIAKELGERKQNVKLDADVTHYELTSDKLAAARKRAEEYEKKFENVV